MVAACAVAFCETVKANGYIPMFYASPSKAYSMDLGYLSGYPFWLAHYTKDQAPSSYRYTFDMWQYSSTWSVPGIDGNVDVNICLTPRWLGGWYGIPSELYVMAGRRLHAVRPFSDPVSL